MAQTWTTAEDFYLRAHPKDELKTLAKALNKTVAAIKARQKKLAIQQESGEGLKGFATNEDRGVVSYTPARALQDDLAAGIVPEELGGKKKTKGGDKYMDRYKNNISTGRPKGE